MDLRSLRPTFETFSLDLSLSARIWVRVGSEGDEAPRIRWGVGGGRSTDGRTDFSCILQDFVSLGAAAKKKVLPTDCWADGRTERLTDQQIAGHEVTQLKRRKENVTYYQGNKFICT